MHRADQAANIGVFRNGIVFERLSSHFKEEGRYFDDEAIRTPATPNPVRQPN